MSNSIHRHFATVDGRWGTRQVHYRQAGDGPSVVLLHQSPQSSREFEPLIAAWSRDFTVIAPDAPGYGQSDPLPGGNATMQDFAEAVIEFGDAIGLGRFGLYGYHTGGGMAVAIADQYPDRCAAGAVNGLVMPTDAELAEILEHYLPPFQPAWDGSHLTWLWARLREQTIFFPWFRRTLGNRMDFSMHEPEALHRNLLEFLRAGDHYRTAYRAAFAYDAAPSLDRLTVPTLITAAELDPLAAHLKRIGEHADCVVVDVSTDHDAAVERGRLQLLKHPGDAPRPTTASRPLSHGLWNDSVGVNDASVRLRRCGEHPNYLVIHDAGGSSLTVDHLLTALEHAAAFDLPGHGESGTPNSTGMESCVQATRSLLTMMPDAPHTLVGTGVGAWVALRVAAAPPPGLKAVVLHEPPLLDSARKDLFRQSGFPTLVPDWHGGYLSRTWHMLRDARLYFPWFGRDRSSIRWTEPSLDEQEITLEVRERLLAEGHWQALGLAALEFEPEPAVTGSRLPVLLAVGPDSPLGDAAQALAEANGAHFLVLPATADQWPDALNAALAALRPS